MPVDESTRILSESSKNEWIRRIKQFFLPVYCLACGDRLLTEENGFFCPQCWADAPWIEAPYCNRCGRPHARMIALGNAPEAYPCADCREHPHRHIDRIFGAARYDGVIEQAVKRLKFRRRLPMARPMGAALRDLAEDRMNPEAYDRIVPVPLHRVRLRERGFNQSLLLAEAVAPCFPAARIDQSLQRIRPTRTQSRLQGAERLANVRGAFAVIGDSLEGARIVLLDDVVTSRGTVTECARVLRKAGAIHIDVLAFALAYPGAGGEG